jgi:hypothetical protein
MSRRRKSSDTTPFDTLRLEGSLFVPELLERAAGGEAAFQKEADYAIPKGLKLHDEYGRAFRIATASWQALAPQMLRADLDAAAVTRAFVIDLFRQCLGYTDLAPLDAPVQLGDRGFPVTAQACGGRLPVIIAPHHLGLDDPDPRFAVIGSGSRKKSAHQLAQEFLNASPNCLWAIVTNGKILRLLRDADTLTRPNFLEFDLETILRDDQHRYADFSALWRILHASRASSPSSPADCIWEKWKLEGHAQGLRVRDGLRDGVTQAILILGRGFLTHPDNTVLRQRLDDGSLSLDDYFQQFFRLIYRCLFLFCTEERDLLHPLDSSPAARKAYASGYSLRRLRRRALRQSAHDPHGDLWLSLRIVFRSLAGGQPRLALPALGGLFAETQCPDLDGASLSNRDLLSAMRELRWFFDKKTGKRSAIDYRNMGTEELGSVYESLLELVPTIDLPARSFGFVSITDAGSTAGNARKTTGSYYTADPLVMELITSALEPVIRQRLADARELAASPWAAVAARIATDSVQRSYVHAWMVKHLAVPIDATPEAFGRAWDAIPAEVRANPLCVEALLFITVCDPSCGSGHFLLAAARRLAERLAELRSPDGAVRPDDYRHALREVASRCLYGVDINPMAVELCRVALWLETVDPGKPLGFLNHHIRPGNSLLGTTPDLIAAGLPDDTFTAIEGDDKPACAELKKRNKAERAGFGPLFAKEEDSIREKLRQAATAIEAMDDTQADSLHRKEAAFLTNETAPEYRHAKLLADLWCAAFVIKKFFKGGTGGPPVWKTGFQPVREDSASRLSATETTGGTPVFPDSRDGCPPADLFGQPISAAKPTAKPKSSSTSSFDIRHSPFAASGITTGTLRDFVQGKPLPEDLVLEVNELASQYRFFHWHLAFPQVFDQGGFDCILGNPPWERVKLQEQEWFSDCSPDIAEASTTSARNRLIEKLRFDNPRLYADFERAVRQSEGCSHFFRNSGLYPLCGCGDVNLYAVFAEGMRERRRDSGTLGIVVPTALVTDTTTQNFFISIVSSQELDSLFDFSNEKGLFIAVRGHQQFSLLTLSGRKCKISQPKFGFFFTDVSELQEEGRVYSLSKDDINAVNPNTATAPVFRNNRDAEIMRHIYARLDVLIRDSPLSNPWGIRFLRMFDVSSDSTHFKTIQDFDPVNPNTNEYLPLFDSKMAQQYNHRAAGIGHSGHQFRKISKEQSSLEDLKNPTYRPELLYYVPKREMEKRIIGWDKHWFLGFKDITGTTSVRLASFSIIPRYGVGHPFPLVLASGGAIEHAMLLGVLNSLAIEYVLRQKLQGLHLTYYYLKQLPVIPVLTYNKPCLWSGVQNASVRDWLLSRVLELTYTAWDLEPFAQDCAWPGPPFRWDEDRRFLLRCELDAAFFHLYLGTEAEWQQQPEALLSAFPTPRHAVSYIMDTFPIVKRKDEAKHGTYRTKETILQIYDALGEAITSGVAYQTQLSPVPTDPRIAHMPKLPDIPRTAFAAQDYFEVVIPLLLSMAPEGLERARLFHAIELLTDSTKRMKAAGNLGDIGTQWAQGFRETYHFADAGKALITEVTKGRVRGVGRMRLDPQAAITTSNPWLCVDAFLALRLALEAEVSVVHASEQTQQALVEQIINIAQVA